MWCKKYLDHHIFNILQWIILTSTTRHEPQLPTSPANKYMSHAQLYTQFGAKFTSLCRHHSNSMSLRRRTPSKVWLWVLQMFLVSIAFVRQVPENFSAIVLSIVADVLSVPWRKSWFSQHLMHSLHQIDPVLYKLTEIKRSKSCGMLLWFLKIKPGVSSFPFKNYILFRRFTLPCSHTHICALAYKRF